MSLQQPLLSGVSGSGREPADHYNRSDSAFGQSHFGHGMEVGYLCPQIARESHEQQRSSGSWGTLFPHKATCFGNKKWRLDHQTVFMCFGRFGATASGLTLVFHIWADQPRSIFRQVIRANSAGLAKYELPMRFPALPTGRNNPRLHR